MACKVNTFFRYDKIFWNRRQRVSSCKTWDHKLFSPFLHRKAEARRHSRTCGQIPQPLRQPLKEIITSRTVKIKGVPKELLLFLHYLTSCAKSLTDILAKNKKRRRRSRFGIFGYLTPRIICHAHITIAVSMKQVWVASGNIDCIYHSVFPHGIWKVIHSFLYSFPWF